MGDIVNQMQDPMKSSNDLENYMQEFKSLRLQLTNERNATYGDQNLHDKYGDSTPFSVNTNAAGTQSVSFAESSFMTSGGPAWDTLIGTDAINLSLTDAQVNALGLGNNNGAGTGQNAPVELASFGVAGPGSVEPASTNTNTNTQSNLEISGEP
jgi:hypothetical protein